MSILLEQRNDGSLAFFLDGELQFDSKDEHIYHECLVLPALALSQSRSDNKAIRALIIGGGDGLSARELLKSSRVSQIDLVDYDAKVLQLARQEFARFNNNSLSDSRVSIFVEDAREFVKRSVDSGIKYDVIISDLTAPHTADEVQLHHVEFYKLLAELLGDSGIIAVNSASPSGTPEAYWSIFNSMLANSLNPRPYRITLPSFAEQDYGDDWGFILASPQAIDAGQINERMPFSEPRAFLHDAAQLREMFLFPQAVLAKQSTSAAGSVESEILLHYLFNPTELETEASQLVDTLQIEASAWHACKPESAAYLFPQDLRSALSHWSDTTGKKEELFEQVFALMPALHSFHTREMIADFLERPAAFLQSINLPELINELLKRAAELPAKLQEELVFLKEKMVDFAHDQEGLLRLGMRSLAIVSLVVVIGNLMYPDAVYAKGGHGGGHAGAHASAHAGGFAHGGVGGGTVHGGLGRGGVVNRGGGYVNVTRPGVIHDGVRVIHDRPIVRKVGPRTNNP